MRIREKLFFPVCGATAVFSVVGYFFITFQLSDFLRNQAIQQIETRMRETVRIIRLTGDRNLETASILSRTPAIVRALEMAGSEFRRSAAREMAGDRVTTLLNGLSGLSGGATSVGLHLPDGRQLLRLRRDERGDFAERASSLSEAEDGFIIAAMDREKTPVQGVEFAEKTLFMSGVAPVFSTTGDYLGAVAVMTGFDAILSHLAEVAEKRRMLYLKTDLPGVEGMAGGIDGGPDNNAVPFIEGGGGRVALILGDSRDIGKKHKWMMGILDPSEAGEFKRAETFPVVNYHDRPVTAAIAFMQTGLSLMEQRAKAIVHFPITDYRETAIGGLILEIDVSDQHNIVGELMSILLGVLIIILLTVLGVMSWALDKAVLNPVRQVIDFSNQISAGDLTCDLDIKQTDEVGTLSVALKNMAVSLAQMFSEIADGIETLNDSAVGISTGAEDQAAVLAQQTGSVSQITSTMSELLTSFSQISEHADLVAQLADGALQHSKEGAESVSFTKTKMEEIDADNQENVKQIMELGRKSKEIAKVMDVINNISDQTKLIAFNAALEAASAGEAGKRFGVVAAEIRRLASSVTESTGEIERRIHEIQEAVNYMIISSEKSVKNVREGLENSAKTAEKLNDIVNGAQSTADAAKQISLSTQQQTTASEQVVVALREIEAGSRHNTESIQKFSDISKELTDLSAYLRAQMENFKLE